MSETEVWENRNITMISGTGFVEKDLGVCQVVQVAVNSPKEDQHMTRVHAAAKKSSFVQEETKSIWELGQTPAGKDVKDEEEVAPVLCF